MTNRDRSLTPPPTKASLKAWWKNFTSAQKFKRDSTNREKEPVLSHVFGVPLRDSLRYANVQISAATSGEEVGLYVYGYVPVVVAKCGLYLKEIATEVEGTFRVSGSNKRMRDLQTVFETPPRYGKNLDWKKENYTTHDVASVFRRYLTQMPEPVIPHNLYHHFRDAYAQKPFVRDRVINNFKTLIRSMPRANQYLLLYVLDLLNVFSRKSDKNLMTAANLAVIFRPGIISHPDQELSPEQHKLSQEVLEFLIEQQDMFILDIPPPPRNDSILIPIPASRVADPDPDLEVYMTPSESDEETPVGGWKLVERGKRPPADTTVDDFAPRSPGDELILSPGGASGVKRSLTAPSRRGTSKVNDTTSTSTTPGGRFDKNRGDPNASTTASGGLKRAGSMQVQVGERRTNSNTSKERMNTAPPSSYIQP